MTKENRNVLDYVVVCVSEFATRYDIQMQEAYQYLRQYKGIDYLQEFYDVEHTLSFEDAINDLTTICQNNGGDIG